MAGGPQDYLMRIDSLNGVQTGDRDIGDLQPRRALSP